MGAIKQKGVAIRRQCQTVVRLVQKKLGNDVRESGKVFYSSPRSLFAGRYILMGYNPGGDPASHTMCRISENLDAWVSIRKNQYWTEKWNKKGDNFNRLQKQVHDLLGNLDINPAEVFTSNLWFQRSRDASKLRRCRALDKACIGIWNELLTRSTARRIICIGVKTARDFLEQIEAKEIQEKTSRTCHPRAVAVLANARIQGKAYKIAAIPHLSRFSVANDPHLIRVIKRHFK
jgi:hypothetical protein